VTQSTRGLLVLFAAAAATGVFLAVTRKPETPQQNVPSASASAPPAAPSVAPPHAATKPEIQSALGILERGVKGGAAAADNPWALAHGLVAFGPEFAAADGRPAIEVIASFAEQTDVSGKKLWLFPEYKAGKPVEPHRFLLVKTLMDVGVPLDRALTTATGAKLTLARLVSDLHAAAALPISDADYHHAAWLLSALVLHEKLDAQAAASAPGPKVRELTERLLERLERDQRVISSHSGPMDQAFDQGTELHRAKRDKTGIYGHTCGGLHLVQAVLLGVAELGDDALASRARKQIGVLLYRYDLERTAYASLLLRHPDQGLLIRIQQLKFFGHLVETLTLARELGIAPPDTEGGRRIDSVIRRAAGDVSKVAHELGDGGVFDRLGAIRKKREQSYLDLIGDGCHAIHGLKRALALY